VTDDNEKVKKLILGEIRAMSAAENLKLCPLLEISKSLKLIPQKFRFSREPSFSLTYSLLHMNQVENEQC